MTTDAAHAGQWLAEARRLLQTLRALRHVQGQGVRGAALDLVPELASCIDLACLAGPAKSDAGFEAACAVHSAAVALAEVAAQGADAEAGDLARAAWLLGRAHVRAQVKVSKARTQNGPPKRPDSVASQIEKLAEARPDMSPVDIVQALNAVERAHDPEYVRKVLRRAEKRAERNRT